MLRPIQETLVLSRTREELLTQLLMYRTYKGHICTPVTTAKVNIIEISFCM